MKRIAIQDEPNNIPLIFADDTSPRNIFLTTLSFISFFCILLFLCIFSPKQSEIVCTTLTLTPNNQHQDVFRSIISNLSSVNQKVRISLLYDNATISKELSHPRKTSVTVNYYTTQGTQLDTTTSTNSIKYDRPVPLFQTSLLTFEKLELNVVIDSQFDRNHSVNLKYEYMSSEATFFQLKVRAILSIISVSIFIFLTQIVDRTPSKVMTLFLHIASLFVFNPLQIIFNYFPSLTFLCFDFIFKNVGIAYVYMYCNLIFFAFDERMTKRVITTFSFVFAILLLVLLSKDFNSLVESFPTIFPIEFNSKNYNIFKFLKSVDAAQAKSDADMAYRRKMDSALKLAFLNSSTLNESNLNMKEFAVMVFLLFVPVFVSITNAILNVQDVLFHRTVVFAVVVAAFACGLTVFYAVDIINGVFHGKLVGWIVPLISLSTFSLLLTYLNLEDDRDNTYESIRDNADVKQTNFGFDEDEEQIQRKGNKKKKGSHK